MVKNVFWCIFAYFQTTKNIGSKKFFYFLTSEVVVNVFCCICAYFQTTRINFFKTIFLMYGVVRNVLWCICTYFQTTRIKFLKKIFFNVWSGEKRVLMHFSTTRIKSLKNYFFTSGMVKNVFWCISGPPESNPLKVIF